MPRRVGPPEDSQSSDDPLLRTVPVVGVGVVDAGRRDVVELLPVARRGLRDVDDLQDLGAAEAGDLQLPPVEPCPLRRSAVERAVLRSGRAG